MIRVKFCQEDNKFISLEIKGHAESTTVEGHDIVCAGVSACAIGALNALENPKNFDIKMEKGLIEVKAINEILSHDNIVLETLLVQLETIQSEYKKFITIAK